MPTPSKMKEIEEKEGKPMVIVLREVFAKHKTQKAVAQTLGVSPSSISLWLMRLHLHLQVILVEEKRDA